MYAARWCPIAGLEVEDQADYDDAALFGASLRTARLSEVRYIVTVEAIARGRHPPRPNESDRPTHTWMSLLARSNVVEKCASASGEHVTWTRNYSAECTVRMGQSGQVLRGYWQRQLEPVQPDLRELAHFKKVSRSSTCCGTGLVSFPVATLVGSAGTPLGVDISEGMV